MDNDTLEIVFPHTTFGLPQSALSVKTDSIGLRPKAEITERGWADFLSDPNLSGAYIPTKSVPAEIKEYEVNVDWFKGEPDFQHLALLEVPEDASRIAMMSSGQADIAAITALSLPQVTRFDRVKIIEQPLSVFTRHYFLNLFRPGDPGYDADYPFMDARVREAFNLAIDRDLIVERIYAGRSVRQDAPALTPGMPGWDHPDVVAMRNNPIPFDPVRARQLLAEASFPMDMKLKMIQDPKKFSGVPELKQLNEAVLTQLRQNLGLDITLDIVGKKVANPHRKDLEAVPYHIHASTRSGTVPTMSGALLDDYFRKGGNNFYLLKGEELEALAIAKKTATDLAEVGRASAEISKILRDEWAFMPLTINPLFFAVQRDRIESWPLAPASWPHYFEYIKAVR